MLLEIDDVTVRFGGISALAGLSLTVDDHEIVGLIGPNGAGKSTALNAVSGFVRPTSGAIYLGGTPLTRLNPTKRARLGIGRTFQTARPFPGLTVAQNLEVVDRQRSADATVGSLEEVLRLCDIADLADVPSDRLTAGQRRFVELARALMLQPRLLLLDEPATGLRANEVRAFGQLLLRLRGDAGIAALLVSHDMQIVHDCCTRVIVLDQGRTLVTGTPSDVRRNREVAVAYFGEELAL